MSREGSVYIVIEMLNAQEITAVTTLLMRQALLNVN